MVVLMGKRVGDYGGVLVQVLLVGSRYGAYKRLREIEGEFQGC